MQYNTSRTIMPIAEYGRSVYQMVETLKSIENREKRNYAANQIIEIMSMISVQNRDAADYKQKLWDHLYILANFDLDIDAPYPKPDPEKLNEKPQRVPYPTNNIRIKHYGKIIERVIDKAIEATDENEKRASIETIGNFMKMSYKTWNKNLINDDEVFADLNKLSNGKLDIDNDIVLDNVKAIPRDLTNPRRNNNNRNNRNNNKQRFQKRKNIR